MARLEIEIGLAGNEMNRTIRAIERLNERLSASEKSTRLFGNTIDQQRARLRTYNSVLQTLLQSGLPTWNQHVQRLKTEIDKLNVSLGHQADMASKQAPLDRLSVKLTQIANDQNLVRNTTARLNAELKANQTAINGLIAQGVDPADTRIRQLQTTVTGLTQALQANAAASARAGFLQQFQQSGRIIPDLEQKIRNLNAALNQATDPRRIAQLNIRLREVQQELDRVRNLGLRAGSAVSSGMNQAATSTQRLVAVSRQKSSAFSGLISQARGLAAAYVSLQAAISVTQRAFRVAMETDAIEVSMSFILNNSDKAASKLEMLRKTADRLGLEYVSMAATYRSFIGATEASNFSMVQAEKIFGAVANAGAKLKLSADQVRGTFLAIEQMVSKGTVSMEELRRQLGDRLPGSFAMAARAMGMTEIEFNKLVSTGQVLSKDLLPKLADELNRVYGNDTTEKIDSLQASVNRLSNEFSDLVEKGNISLVFQQIVDGATNALSSFNKLVFSGSFKTFVMRFMAGSPAMASGISAAFKDVADVLDTVDDHLAKLADDPSYKVMAEFATKTRQEMERVMEAQEAIMTRAAERHTRTGSEEDLKFLTQQAEQLARMRSHYGQLYLIQAKSGEETKKNTDAANKLSAALAESYRRVALARARGDETELQRIQNWYESILHLAEGNAAALVVLEQNLQAELTEVRAKAAEKALEDGEKQRQKNRENLAKNAAKYLQDIRKQQADEAEITLVYQRRLYENRAQVLVRHLNDEFRTRLEAENRRIRSEIEKNGESEAALKDSLNTKQKLQEEYFRRIEEISRLDREIQIQAAFDGDAFSVPIAKVNDQVAELKRSFEAGTLSVEQFRAKISELSAEREQLQLMQNTVDGIAGAFGNLYADAIFNTEDALENLGKTFENLAKNIISGLIKIGARYLINQSIGTASMATTAATSAATATTVASAWATAAALVSAATFGANVAAGGAALTAFMASTKALSLFKRGGYTGNVGVNEVAGIVHGQEFVVNAQATKQYLPLLTAINSGTRISSSAGAVAASALRTGGASPVTVHVVGEISGENIKLAVDRASRSFGRFYGQ